MTLLGLDLAAPYPPELCYLAGAVPILLGWVGWRRGCRLSSGPTLLLIRHPQHIGVLLIALGLFVRWATLPFMSIWPLLLLISSWAAGQGRVGPERGLHEALRGNGEWSRIAPVPAPGPAPLSPTTPGFETDENAGPQPTARLVPPVPSRGGASAGLLPTVVTDRPRRGRPGPVSEARRCRPR